MRAFTSLIWSDEFDYTGAPDPAKWSFDLGHGTNGWGNREAQEYADDASVCRVEDGVLRITARRRESDSVIRSARLHTYGKGSWTYGAIEYRAKLPSGKGTWPAVWMLSDKIRQGTPWPLCGEIDLLEHVGRDQDTVHFSLHCEAFNHGKNNQATSVHVLPGVSDDFHTYRCEWDEDGFEFYVDGEKLAVLPRGTKEGEEQWPFDQDYHIIVNFAIGGNWGGEIDENCLPAVFELDYIRIYQ